MRLVPTILFMLVSASAATAIGCHRDHPAEGPAERAGKHIDNAGEKVGDAAHRAKEDVKEKVDK